MRPPRPPQFQSYHTYIKNKYYSLLKDAYEETLKYISKSNFSFDEFISIVIKKENSQKVSIYHHYISNYSVVAEAFIKVEILFSEKIYYISLRDIIYIPYREKFSIYNKKDIKVGDEFLYLDKKHIYLGRFTEKKDFAEYYFLLEGKNIIRVNYKESFCLYDRLFDQLALESIVKNKNIIEMKLIEKNKKYISINDNFNLFLNKDYFLNPKEAMKIEIDRLSLELFS